MEPEVTDTRPFPFHRYTLAAAVLVAFGALYATSRWNYPLFHSLVESLSILIAFGIFVFTWNCRRFLEKSFFLVIGIAYLFVGGLDLLHTFAYKGVSVFGTQDPDLATQLWISARYLEAGSLFLAAMIMGRKTNPIRLFLVYTNIFALVIASIFAWNIFPQCYVSAEAGLGYQTTFKVVSEYVICGLLLGALLRVRRERERFDDTVFLLLSASILITFLSEFAFTLYADVYGIFNALGHMFKVASFYLLYKAIIETGLIKPYNILFRDLQESEKSLKKEQSLLEEVIKQMPAGVVIVDAHTEKVLLTNPSALESQYRPDSEAGGLPMPGQKVFRADGTPYRYEQWPLLRALRKGEEVKREQVEIQRDDGSFATLLVDAAPVRDAGGRIQAAVSTFHDVTERQRMEDSLRRARNQLEARVKQRTTELARTNEALKAEVKQRRQVESELREYAREWRTTFDAINEAVCLTSLEGRIHKHNRSFARLVGAQHQDITGQKCYKLIDCQYEQEENCPLRRMRRTRERESAEISLGDRHYLATADPLHGEAGELCGSVHTLRDITEEKKAEKRIQNYQEELRSLASELTLAEERERRRLSTALHDNIAQSLALSKIKLGAVQTAVDDRTVEEEITNVRDLIDESITRTRSLIFELSPPILYQMGLEAALETLADNFAERHDVMIRFYGEDSERPLQKELEVVLFQSARELLMNAVKHADATELELSVQRKNGKIRVSVKDDGQGFDTQEIGPHQHRDGGYGLFSIRERMERFKGDFNIQSEIGEGTRATLTAPVETPTDESESTD